MAWINLVLGAYAIWRAAYLHNERKPLLSWGTMAAAGVALLTSAGLRFSGIL